MRVLSTKVPCVSGLGQYTKWKKSRFCLVAAAETSDSDSKSTNVKKESRSPPQKLTARERLRAARVLSRYTDTKPPPELGNKLLDALQQSDVKGKKLSGLPQPPTNLFDDSKRGMPKSGWTFDFPGGIDVFFIAFFSSLLVPSCLLQLTPSVPKQISHFDWHTV
ncbi:hypothetical protein ACS0TY_014136 [Phlomoides rotata]